MTMDILKSKEVINSWNEDRFSQIKCKNQKNFWKGMAFIPMKS